MQKSFLKKFLVYVLIVNMGVCAMPQFLMAAPIGTQTLQQLENRQELIDHVRTGLARDDVRETLIHLGVAPEAAQERVAALTDSELQALSAQIDDLPAGGNVLALLGLVFVVLLILDLTGVTNVFSAID